MTDLTEPRESLRLAFSEFEKAKALHAEAVKAFQQKELDETKYRSLHDFYGHHMQVAKRKIERLREDCARRNDARRNELQEVGRRQAELNDRVAAGDVPAAKANKLNRECLAAIKRIRNEYKDEERLIKARTSLELGGFVDRPLEAYAGTLRKRRPPVISPDRLAGMVVPVLAALCVFLTWRTIDGRPHALAEVLALGPIRDQLGAPIRAGAILVGFIVLPLVGALFAAVEHRRIAGLGMLLTGTLTVLAGLAAIGAAAWAAPAQPGDLVASLRVGAIAYALGGIALAYLANRRLRANDQALVRGSRGVALLGGGAVIAVIAVGVHLLLQPGDARARFAMLPVPAGESTVPFTCANVGSVPIDVYLPWPETGPRGGEVDDPHDAFGAVLYVREAGRDALRPYPGSQECWLHDGAAPHAGEPLTLQPGTNTEFRLAPAALRQAGLQPEALRVVFTDGRNRSVAAFDVGIAAQ